MPTHRLQEESSLPKLHKRTILRLTSIDVLDVLNATGITPNFNSIHPGAAGNHCNAADPYNFTDKAGYIAEW